MGLWTAEVGPVHRDERLAEIAQGGLAARPELALGHDDPHGSPVRVDDLAVADLVLQPAQAVDARRVAADAQLRLLGHLDLGDQVAGRRIPPGKVDAGRLADDAASAVAPDEVLRPQRLAVGAARHRPRCRPGRSPSPRVRGRSRTGSSAIQAAMIRSIWFCQIPSEYGWRVGKVAHVQHGRGQHRRLRHLTLREEPIGDPTLIEHLDRARVKTAGPRADEHVIGTPLDDGDIDLRQGQLSRQHHPRRASSGDHHSVFGLTHSFSLLRWLPPAAGDYAA